VQSRFAGYNSNYGYDNQHPLSNALVYLI